jgi:RNA polymerase sigma factor (sigma-70 family)
LTDETPIQQIDDETLVLRMMEQDEQALAKVLELYGPRVKGYLRRKFGDVLREPELAESFNVAAFNLWRFADRFRPEKGSLRGWFITIARNAAVSLLRSESLHVAKELEYEPEYDPADCSDDDPPVDSKEHRRLKELDHILNTKLTGFEQIVALNDFKAGCEADAGRLAAQHGKSKQMVYTTRSKVKKKITEWMREWDLRQRGKKG